MRAENLTFKKAKRYKAKLRLALCGVSGSGKTYSSILIAKGLGGKIAMVDTEYGSGELYANLADYDVLPITAPYCPKKYIAAIKAAEQAGYSTIIIDSLSHAWAGEGGLLELVDKIAASSNSKNPYLAWRGATPLHNALVEAITTSPIHVIVTMRSKTAYEIQDTGKGKAPVKMGLAPVQRDGMEYEFTVVLDLSSDKNIATASKDRTGLFQGKYACPSEKMGEELLEWLNTGAEAPSPPPPVLVVDNAPKVSIADQLSAMVDAIQIATTQNDLKRAFATAYRFAQAKAPDAIDEVKDSYEARKEFLAAEQAGEDVPQ